MRNPAKSVRKTKIFELVKAIYLPQEKESWPPDMLQEQTRRTEQRYVKKN